MFKSERLAIADVIATLDFRQRASNWSDMKAKRILFLCFLPVFIAMALVGMPPPMTQRVAPNQQEQGQMLEKNTK